ncbi:hypothetical protein [Singulisphaera sp. PoT]|uniref:hypothetical protein n=1 Tax=Singulisphaera sp. PoT TaxID=3411797 RepID=UPI003BF59C49
MRQFGSLSVAFLAVVFAATTADAQGPGRGRGMGMGFGQGTANLIRNSGVQKELKLSDEATEKVKTLADDMGKKMMEKFQDLSQDERREKGMAIAKEINDETKAALKGILSPEQLTRLEQISIQTRGLEAFSDEQVVSKLKLTDDQKSKIKEIGEDVRSSMQDLRSSFQDDREGAMKKMTALRKESFEKATALLTDDQKKAWKELTGEPFDYKPEFRRPGA